MDILTYAFMQRALLSGTLIGILCATVGVYVVLRGMSFIGAGIAHASFGGVAVGFLLGINPLLSAVVFCLLVAWGIAGVARSGQVKEDTAVGVFFASTMALGILIIGLMKGYNVELFSYLFGSILAVTQTDVWLTVGVSIGVLGVIALLYKELEFITFDAEMAQVVGLPVTALYFLLLTLIALTVVISIKVVGIVLVSALIVTPAAAAWQLTYRFRVMMALSMLFGAISTIGGLLLSYWLNTASGATIVILATAIFFLAFLFSPKRERPLWQRTGR